MIFKITSCKKTKIFNYLRSSVITWASLSSSWNVFRICSSYDHSQRSFQPRIRISTFWICFHSRIARKLPQSCQDLSRWCTLRKFSSCDKLIYSLGNKPLHIKCNRILDHHLSETQTPLCNLVGAAWKIFIILHSLIKSKLEVFFTAVIRNQIKNITNINFFFAWDIRAFQGKFSLFNLNF